MSRRRALELTLRTGLAVRTPYFRARYLLGEGPPGVAFLAGKKVGGAVRRNRAKRVLREAFRTSKANLSGIETLVFIATDLAATARYSDVRQSLHSELSRISDRDS
ncbi:MAG: ribonuclease P protein component [Candidatus Eisenbacteria bacterium]|nr:ribonuclease P protein component [Candidatus Eisenbacteria bacterium]